MLIDILNEFFFFFFLSNMIGSLFLKQQILKKISLQKEKIIIITGEGEHLCLLFIILGDLGLTIQEKNMDYIYKNKI